MNKNLVYIVLVLLGAMAFCACVCIFGALVFRERDTTPTPLAQKVEHVTTVPTETTSPTLNNKPLPIQTNTLEPSITPEPSQTPIPKDMSEPSSTPLPSVTPEPLERLCKEVKVALGDSNRGVNRVVWCRMEGVRLFIRWSVNMPVSLSTYKREVAHDLLNMLYVIQMYKDAIPFDMAVLQGMNKLTDMYGNAEETPVIKAYYSYETIQKINFSNGEGIDVYAITDDLWLHPDLK
jgi:hypothetical protein